MIDLKEILTVNNKIKILLTVISGIFIGFINGFLGGGGGLIVVVALLWLFKLPQKNAQATALLVILPISVVSAVIYIINGNGDWEKILFATIGVVAGGVVGALILGKLKGNVVKLIFALISIAAGVRMFL